MCLWIWKVIRWEVLMERWLSRMNEEQIKVLLKQVKTDEVSLEDATKALADLPFKDLGFAMIDNHREVRVGYPEVIYCQGKTNDQVRQIISYMLEKDHNILGTRAEPEMFEAVKDLHPDLKYSELGRVISLERQPVKQSDHYIAIVSAGTSDLPVVEEARITAELLGNQVRVITDVGVAGIHRLFHRLHILREAKVLIVVAGMEGALASVVGGLVDRPIIAVPTSVGYGANFGGVSALLSMLNSCASGVSVVNIDNGFGAAYNASMINQL